MDDNIKLAIIGGGNLGTSIAEGLLNSHFIRPENLIITKRNIATLTHLEQRGVTILSDNKKAAQMASVILLAVKPYNVKEILQEINTSLQSTRHILISVVTGVLLQDLEKAAVISLPIFRAMPNTAIAIQESVTCICHQRARPEQIQWVQTMFEQLGVVVNIDEKLMDAATVLGACGIAYALRFIRANIQGGIEIGFDAKTANLIAAQTVKGAASLLIKGNKHPEEEIDKVTTPKGCTIVGLNEMEHQGFSSSLIKGIMASYYKLAKD